jgi:hypothetical protein
VYIAHPLPDEEPRALENPVSAYRVVPSGSRAAPAAAVVPVVVGGGVDGGEGEFGDGTGDGRIGGADREVLSRLLDRVRRGAF